MFSHLNLRWFAVLVSLLIAITPVFAEMEIYAGDEEDSGKDLQKIYHLDEDIDLIPTTQLRYGKHSVIAKSIYPLLTSAYESENINDFNQLVSDILKDWLTHFKQKVAENQSVQQNMPVSDRANNLTIDFDTAVINLQSAPIVSVRFTIEAYLAGMAHPYHRHAVLNFDLNRGKKIELADLFLPNTPYLDVIANYSRQVLTKKLKPAENQSLILAGTEPLPENYANWNLSPEGLLITFDEYQVASYVYGTQTVLIPYGVLQAMISQDSPLGMCLHHKKQCLRNHLLTGSFEEA